MMAVTWKTGTPPKDGEYLVTMEDGRITTMGWAGGWNCLRELDGTISRTFEIDGVTAWTELPEPYKTPRRRSMIDLISRADAVKAIWDVTGEIRPSVLEEIIDRLNRVPSADAIEIGVEYDARGYSVILTTNSKEGMVDGEVGKYLARNKTFKVEKNDGFDKQTGGD